VRRLPLIPDCGDENSIAWWDYQELNESDLRCLVQLANAQVRPVDKLGSTPVAERMAYVFSAMTGIPTSAEILFQNLVDMRKSGNFPELQKGRAWKKALENKVPSSFPN